VNDLAIVNKLRIKGIKLLRSEENEFDARSEYDTYVLKNRQVTKLMISNKKIDFSTLEDIFKLTHLEELYLRKNNICKIPDTIIKLQYLRRIHLGNNALMQLPECLTELKKLNILSTDVTII